jgi:hypothetical protein
MRVVFLALGANRRLAVTAESRLLVEAGGQAVVLVQNPRSWAKETFAPGVEVVALEPAGRLRRALYRRSPVDRTAARLARFHRRHGPFDAVVVTDPLSFPAAQRLAGLGDARVAFRLDQLPAGGPA